MNINTTYFSSVSVLYELCVIVIVLLQQQTWDSWIGSVSFSRSGSKSSTNCVGNSEIFFLY